jgi:AcrR family transcriptional regulator
MRDTVQHGSTRDAILDATDHLLSRYGYKKMTIDDLAAEVGIGKGTVYLYFPSKEEIVLSHIDRIIERLKARLWAIVHKDLPPDEKIRRMMVERVVYRFDSVQHYTQSLNEMLAKVRAKLLDRRTRYFLEEAQIFAKVLEDGNAEGVFDVSNAIDTAETLLYATNSLLPYSLSVKELGDRKTIAKRTAAIAEVCLSGLMARNDKVNK